MNAAETAGLHERIARRRKCERVVSHMLNKLADLLEGPEGEVMMLDAARCAGVNQPSKESQVLIITMVRERAKYE